MSTILEDVDATPLDGALVKLRRLVSPHTGLVQLPRRLLASPTDGRLIRAACEVVDDECLLGRSLAHLDGGGGGSGATWEQSLAAALGEVAERYAATFVPSHALVTATAEELGEAAVEPRRFALFHPAQYGCGFPFEPFTRSTRLRFARGFSLVDGRPAYLPAQLVYLGRPDAAAEPLVGYSTSNGLACGASREEAVLSGLLELVERDAFMITWYARLSLPQLDWGGSARLRELDDAFFAGTGGSYRVVDLSAFLDVPVVLAVVRGEGRLPAVSVGAAAAASVEEAWLKALGEAFAVRIWGEFLLHEQPDRRFEPGFGDIETFADHVHLFARREHAFRADFLTASRERRAVAEVPRLEGERPLERIRALVARLAARGMEAYAVDVTSPDIAEAGLAVVKVVVPELCPLDVHQHARYLGAPRLRRVPLELGLRQAELELAELNPDPHPFP